MGANDAFAGSELAIRRGPAHSLSGTTGIIGAALAQNSAVLAMRSDPTAGASWHAYIARIRLEWTTIVAFTTPITAARRLGLYRGAGANTTGGTALAPVKRDTGNTTASEFLAASGGDSRIATTAALGGTPTWEADPIREMSLVHVGAAGAYREAIWEFSDQTAGPFTLAPGELLGIRNPVVMDAGGTWQLAFTVDYNEIV